MGDHKYFVVSGGDEPYFMRFSLEEAQKDPANGDYIDVFDSEGERVDSYKFVDGAWTDTF